MATTVSSVDVAAKIFPFQQPVSFNASRYSTVPWGQTIVNETFQTPVIGAGDDGLVIFNIELPADYVALLRNFHLQVVDTDPINWRDAVFGFAYQQPGGPYKNSVNDYAEDEYSWYQLVPDDVTLPDRFATDRRIKTWQFGAQDVWIAFNDAWDPTQVPLWVPPTVDANFRQRQVIGFVECQSDSQPAQQMTLRASFDLFTFDQAYSAAVMSSPRVFN